MSKQNLIVLAHSDPWCSAISRSFPDYQLTWVLSLRDLVEESLKHQASVAVVELPITNPAEFCIELYQLENNSVQMKTFVVGDQGLLKWRPLLRAVGVAAWYWSFLQIPSLVGSISNHFASVRYQIQSTETRVWEDLPWASVASSRQA